MLEGLSPSLRSTLVAGAGKTMEPIKRDRRSAPRHKQVKYLVPRSADDRRLSDGGTDKDSSLAHSQRTGFGRLLGRRASFLLVDNGPKPSVSLSSSVSQLIAGEMASVCLFCLLVGGGNEDPSLLLFYIVDRRRIEEVGGRRISYCSVAAEERRLTAPQERKTKEAEMEAPTSTAEMEAPTSTPTPTIIHCRIVLVSAAYAYDRLSRSLR